MRHSPAELSSDDFRAIGHELVDRIADFLSTIADRPVAPDSTPSAIRALLGTSTGVPSMGEDAESIVRQAAQLIFDHSTFNGHPRFFGYITSSAAPIGALADMLAASVNPNVGAWGLSPVATEIERQSVRWVAELIGYSPEAGGILVSGGNMANMVCLLAAIRAQSGPAKRTGGVGSSKFRVYASAEVHTWLQKGLDICGLGTDALRAVPVDAHLALDVAALERMITEDRTAGFTPSVVVGTAGSVSTGAIDPLDEIAALCKREKIWFHVDGAYGAPAAMLDDAPAALRALSLGDSVAVDPHKWLYSPIEAGCSLVRNPEHLHDAFVFHPPYYRFAGDATDPPTNFHEWGPQNSRGFRALKVWMTIRQVGRDGYERMLTDDIGLARELHALAGGHEDLEAMTCSLSIATFRFVPKGKRLTDDQLNALNGELLARLQSAGKVYLSNAVIGGRFALRACIVNFRTSRDDIRAVIDEVVSIGRELARPY
jgi:aromatic-L-amino-acid/L-tryptophan decarboxylase